MSFFGSIFRKSATVREVTLEEIAADHGLSGLGIASPEAALQVSAVLCAVRVIAEGMGQMPLMIRRREMRGAREYNPMAREHHVWKLFNRQPNGFQTPYEFVEHAVMIAAITGEFIAVKVTDSRGNVRELLPVLPGAWSVEQKPDYSLEYTINLAGGRQAKYTQAQIFTLRGPSFNAYRGLAPVRLAAVCIGLARSLENQQRDLAKNGGRPSGVLAFPDALGADVKDSLRKAWAKTFGVGGPGGVAVLDKGAKFQSMVMTSVDAQHLETRRFQIEEIARVFRVSPLMLQQTDKASTFASAEQFFRAHVIHTLGPWMKRFEAAVNLQIIGPKDTNVFADFDERQLLRGDFKDQAAYLSAALGGSGAPAWMTQNEAREDVGLDPVDQPEADILNSERGQDAGEGATTDGA